MSEQRDATYGETPDEWYEREKTAFRAWWESDDNEKTFSSTPTMAAGAGWFARAEAAPETAPIVPCLATNGCTTPEWCARNGDACRVKTPVSETAQKPSCIYRTGCETPNDCREHGYCRSPRNAAPQEAPAARPAMEGSGDSQSITRPTQPSSVEPAVAAPVSVPSAIRQKERECPTCGAYEGEHLYCKTCGSCGEDGCCPPEKCQKARRNETIEECAKLAEPKCDPSLDSPWEKGYWAAENSIAHNIRTLKNATPQANENAADAKDAARYRWLNKADNFIIEIAEIRDGLPYKHRRLKCGAVLDKWIDALIKQESE